MPASFRRSVFRVTLFWLLALCTVGPAAAQQNSAPIVTELLTPLGLSRAKTGAPIFLRVMAPWQDATCTLKPGSTVAGTLVSFVRRSKTDKNSEAVLTFTSADCVGKPSTPHRFTLIALISTDAQGAENGDAEPSPLSDLPFALGGAVNSPIRFGTRSVSEQVSLQEDLFSWSRIPRTLVPGQVIGLGKTRLGAGKGVDGASVITSSGNDVRLDLHTVFVLAPGSLAPAGPATPTSSPTPTPTSSPLAPGAAAPIASLKEEPDETEVCSGLCTSLVGSAAGPDTATDRDDTSLAATLPLTSLGFRPRQLREINGLNHESTLTFLDAHTLLCTFDPHLMRTRSHAEDDSWRTIRAVLIDADTHAVRRVVSWRVRGETQYLWRLSGGRIVVHVGHDLEILDAELKRVGTLPLAGPLAWVVASPAGDHIGVGTVRERHTREVHEQLAQVEARAPEEDTLIRVYDSALKQVIETERSSRAAVPVFSDRGELRVHSLGHGRWQLGESRWDQSQHVFATTHSTCRPTLTTPAPGLVFALGCGAVGRWYRMLRDDGHPLLKAESPSNEIEVSAEGSTGGLFAVRVMQTHKATTPGTPFTRDDLFRERINIFRSSDGAEVTSINTPNFSLSQLAYSLSPTGDRLALVGTDSIQFYALSGAKR